MNHYGCHNTERREGYWGRELCFDGDIDYPPEYGMMWIEDAMSPDCQYRKTTPDPKCEGCTK
jgi:hypothetical protein